MKILISILFIGLGITVNAQVKQKSADAFYALEEYSKCVGMYDELANKFTSGSNKGDWNNVLKAAVCHYRLYEMKEAKTYFGQLKTLNKLDEKSTELYINCLRFLGDYKTANELTTEASYLYGNNAYFSRLVQNQSNFNSLLKDSSRTTISAFNGNSNSGDFSPSYYENGIVFATKSRNAERISSKYSYDDDYYVSLLFAAKGQDSIFKSPELLKDKFLSKAHDGPVDFNADETQMVITKNQFVKKGVDQKISLGIYFSSKINGEWTALVPFEYNDPRYNVGHGVFSEDGKKIYFSSDSPEGLGGADIYVSEFVSGRWSKPINLGPTINTEKDELFPFVNNSTLYFASSGHFGLGGLDIFESDLNTKSTPVNLGYPVNSSGDDFGYISKSDGKEGYFSSNRFDFVDRIYEFKRKPIRINVNLLVYEKYANKELLVNQEVVVNYDSGESKTFITDQNGLITFPMKTNESIEIVAEKTYFKLQNAAKVNTANIDKDTTFEKELILLPTTITVHLKVVEKGTHKPLIEANASVMDYSTNKDTMMLTNSEGMVTMTVDRNKTYWAHGAKQGYIDSDIAFNTTDEDGKFIELELALPPIQKGEKFKLENIFYDLNKSTLRPESMASLDKLADFLIKNNLKIELSAHTDSRGSNSYNQKLSQARAQSCVDYLLTRGVSKSKMLAKGYGESQLVNKCKNGVECSEEEHQDNRRTEVKILEVK